MLERADLLRTLQLRRDEAAGGRGSLVLVAGEAGSGKTTLIEALIEHLDSSTSVITGACDPLSTPRPLGPLRDFAADPASGLADLELGDRDTASLFADVLHRVQNTARPTVMIVEDVHWADEATLDFLRFMGRRVRDTTAVLVCTYRDDELGADHPLRTVLGQLAPLATTHRLDVPALSIDAVAQLAGVTAIEAAALHERTEGNAFFVTEVIAAGVDLPGSVQDAVVARLSQLDAPARLVVETVSIAPRSLEIDRVVALTEASHHAVDATVASGVLRSDSSQLRFRHELARAGVEESLPPAKRLDLHRRMIALLEAEGEDDAARLAHHAVRAAYPELIVRCAPPAAGEAVRRGARREAVELYRAALAHERLLGVERAADLWFCLGRELTWIDDPLSAVEALQRSITLHEQIGDVEAQARALVALQSPLWEVEGQAAGHACTQRALELLTSRGPSEALALTWTRIAHDHMIAREREPASDAIAEAGAIAEQVGSRSMLWYAEMLRGTVEIVMGNPELGVEILEESVRTAEAMDEYRLLGTALGMLGTGGGEARRYAAAIPALERGVEHGIATDNDYEVAYNRAWLARIAFEKGSWDDAVDHAERALNMPRSDGITAPTADSVIGRVRVRRGDPGGAERLDEVLAGAEDPLFQYVWNAYCGRAEHAWLRGTPDEATPILHRAFERAMATDSPWARGEVGFWMWRAGLIDHSPEGSAEPFALQIDGDWRSAAHRWNALGCPYETAMALADGDEPAMRQAVEILDRLGAAPAAHLVRTRLRDAGAATIPRGPIRATLANPGHLTSRQLDVLGLMADGLSNGEIAARLIVSKKTVEHHVSAIFSKLGVDSRGKAVAVARQRSIIKI